MIVLGIIGFGENPAACLVRDGHLVSFAEEERFFPSTMNGFGEDRVSFPVRSGSF